MTIAIILGMAIIAGLGFLFLLVLCLAAQPPRNKRRHRLGQLLSMNHPEWN
jgi:hypothetical protein